MSWKINSLPITPSCRRKVWWSCSVRRTFLELPDKNSVRGSPTQLKEMGTCFRNKKTTERKHEMIPFTLYAVIQVSERPEIPSRFIFAFFLRPKSQHQKWVHMLDRGSRAVNNISANQLRDLRASRVYFFLNSVPLTLGWEVNESIFHFWWTHP